MHEVWDALTRDFTDLPTLAQALTLAMRLLLAVLLAGLLGLEREHREATAGLRTHMLVGLGAATFVVVPQQVGVPPGDLTRVLQGVMVGIGFLGAGAILKPDEGEHVRGLTTAASIWATAAIGVAAGMGRALSAVMAAVLALVILRVVLWWERRHPSAGH
jgi:putative Mg2+ transporter-C (MgtC) family protein